MLWSAHALGWTEVRIQKRVSVWQMSDGDGGGVDLNDGVVRFVGRL